MSGSLPPFVLCHFYILRLFVLGVYVNLYVSSSIHKDNHTGTMILLFYTKNASYLILLYRFSSVSFGYLNCFIVLWQTDMYFYG
jgi:hypothetical protein